MENTNLEQLEEINQEKFNAMMDSLFPLAERLHDLGEENLTDVESQFLTAFDEYIDSACELYDEEEDGKDD